MENQSYINQDSRYQIKLISFISLGMFLFMLFFQPFEYKLVEFNERLIFILGVGVVTFLILLIFRIILPVSVTGRIQIESFKISNEIGLILLIWLFITAGNIVYLKYVGGVQLTLVVAVKISLFSAFPSIVLKLADVNLGLREQTRLFARRNIKLERELANAVYPENLPIVFQSETQKDKLEISPDDIILIRSADNYVDIYYRKDDKVEHKLLRNTMKYMQYELRESSDFIRCHRTSIVNSNYILNMTNSYKGHRLIMLDLEEEIPVSRQYIIGIKEALDTV